MQLAMIPVSLMILCMATNSIDMPKVYCVELFAGVAAFAGGFTSGGFGALTFDRKHGSEQDINSWDGWLLVLNFIMNVPPGGLIWLGTVCSTWIVTSRGSTGRSASCVLGSQKYWTVTEANKMAARSALVAFIACIRGVGFVLEQPQTSLMMEMPCWKFLAK